MTTTALSAFRIDPVSGLRMDRTASTLIKANAVAAVVFLLIGGFFGMGVG